MKRNVILYFYNLGKFNIRAKQVKKKYVTPVIKKTKKNTKNLNLILHFDKFKI